MNKVYIYIPLFILFLSCTKLDPRVIDREDNVDYHIESTSSFPIFETQQHIVIVDSDDDLVFGSINQIQLLNDGTILAFDPSLITIHHFDSLGNELHRIGREGSGPGEFSNEANIRADGNKVYVFERLALKVEVFEYQQQSWTHLQTISIDKIDDDVPEKLLKVKENKLWFVYRHFYQGDDGVSLAKDHITQISMSGGVEGLTYDTWLAELPQTESIFEDLGGFIASYPKPYGFRPITAITSDDHIILAKSDQFRFGRIIPEVDSTLTIQMDVPNIVLTEAEKNNLSGYHARIHSLVRDNMPEMRPSTIPIILTDEKNGFWVGYESSDFDNFRWIYFDQNSQANKEVYLPSNFRPQATVDNMIYGILRNEDGSQSIIGYLLHRI